MLVFRRWNKDGLAFPHVLIPAEMLDRDFVAVHLGVGERLAERGPEWIIADHADDERIIAIPGRPGAVPRVRPHHEFRESGNIGRLDLVFRRRLCLREAIRRPQQSYEPEQCECNHGQKQTGKDISRARDANPTHRRFGVLAQP